jgi:hypothetical protein
MSEGACYQHWSGRDMAVLSLLRVEAIRDRGFPIEEFHDFAFSIDPPFLDALRIATSFENLFKAELLAFGYVVHEVDARAAGGRFKSLANQQMQRPIRISELRAA